MMKKWMAYLCTGMMAASLAACGNGGQTGDDQIGAAEDRTEINVVAGSQTGGGADDQTVGGTAAASPSDSGAGAADSVQTGAVGSNGHNYEEGWTEEMEGIKAAILEQVGDDYFPNMALLPDMLELQFGITPDMYDDYLAEMPMISANVDTLLIIRAKDDKVEEVKAALEAYQDTQINGTLQYPMNLGIVQASSIAQMGNYVCFSQLGGDIMDLVDIGDEAVILHCQELNALVIAIISEQLGLAVDG